MNETNSTKRIISLSLFLLVSPTGNAFWIGIRKRRGFYSFLHSSAHLSWKLQFFRMDFSTVDYAKMACSMGLVVFSIVVVTALIFTENTQMSRDGNPWTALVVMWLGILWMSMVEGGQCSMVGLPPVNRDLYKDTHPITHRICYTGHRGDNLDRYLMGRQFLVIFINFTINLCGAPLANAAVLSLPDPLTAIFLSSGLAMVLIVVVVGQLTSQVNASHCMLDYINTYFMSFTLFIALAIEKTGVMHACYLLQILAYKAAGKPVATNEPPRTRVQAFFFWGRVVWSLTILGFAFAVTLTALFDGRTTMWDGVPNGVAVGLFFLLMACVGLLEGMQIAFFSVAKLRKDERGEAPWALKTCELLFRRDGRNLPGFMVGRQMTVTLCFFVIARVTTLDVDPDSDETIFGVSPSIQKFFNMGFLGAIITTILGSISWQLVASAFPLAFLSNPIVYAFLKLALWLEWTGVCSGAWFLGILHKKMAGFQLDEVYIGTPEERAAMHKADLSSIKGDSVAEPHLGTHVLTLAPGASRIPDEWKSKNFQSPPKRSQRLTFTERRAGILSNIRELREQIRQSSTAAEQSAYKTALALETGALAELNKEQMLEQEEEPSDLEGEDAELGDEDLELIETPLDV